MKDRQTDKGREVESDTRQRQRKTDEQRQSEELGESEMSLGDPWPASISGASQAEYRSWGSLPLCL